MISNLQITHFFLLSQNDFVYYLLLSSIITEPNFNFIPCAKIKIHGGADPVPPRTIYAQRTICQGIFFKISYQCVGIER